MNNVPLLEHSNGKRPEIDINFKLPEADKDQQAIIDYLVMTGLLFFLKGVDSEVTFTINGKNYLAKANRGLGSIDITEA